MRHSFATVSVLMPVYNTEAFVGAAIESILGQTWRDFEFLIVDDGSTDNSSAIVQSYANRDPRIRLVRGNHEGVAAALNQGLALARGDIVVRQDADDISKPQRLERQLSYLAEHREIAVVGCNMGKVDESGQTVEEPFPYSTDPAVVEEHLLRGYAPLAHPAVAFRRNVISGLGGYRTQFNHAEDYDLWLRVSEHHLLGNVPEALVDYRWHGRQVSRRHRYDQHLAARLSRLSARARRQGLPDPLEGLHTLSLTDLDRFDIPTRERTKLSLELTEAALRSFEATGQKGYLTKAERSLLFQPSSEPQAEQLLSVLARLLWKAGERRKALNAAARMSRIRVARIIHPQASDTKVVAQWLVACADPMGLRGRAPRSLLSAASIKELVDQAEAHGVLPALLRHFPDLTEDGEIAPIKADAEARSRLAAAHSVMLRHQAEALVEEGSGLPFMVVKGPVFARLLYPNARLRPFTDIDLLADPDCVPQISDLLQSNGFVLAEEDAHSKEWKWVHRDNSALLVEVQTDLVHAESLSRSLSLTYRHLADIGETPAAQLMVATLHGALGAHFEKLRHAVDIAQAARRLPAGHEEERFLQLVAATGTRLAAKTGLRLAGKLFDEPRCAEIDMALGPEKHTALASRLITPIVVTTIQTAARSRYSWRRSAFRELLKRSSIGKSSFEIDQSAKSHFANYS